jgi:hypothetical protein
MLRSLLSVFGALALLLTLLPALPTAAQSGPNPRFVFTTLVPNVNNIKRPDIAVSGSTVHVSANVNRLNAVYYTKQDVAQSFIGPEVIGLAPGQADSSTTSIATAPNGSVHYAWINQEARTISYRTKPADGAFGPARTVATSAFPVDMQVGVTPTGTVFVVWRDPDQPFKYSVSTDGSAFSPPQSLISRRANKGMPDIAVGPNGEIVVAFNDIDLQIFGGFWNGTTFDVRQISNGPSLYADPTATFDPDGNAYIAYRGVPERGNDAGVYVATHVGSNNWQVNQLVQGIDVKDNVNIDADPDGNLHLVFTGNVGVPRLFYAVRPKGGQFSSPLVEAPASGGAVFFAAGAANVSDNAYQHVVGEFFVGDNSQLRYYLFAADSDAIPAVGAKPVIEDNRVIVRAQPTYNVTFTNVTGNPDQVRWRWGEAPTDAATDSDGWQPFAASIEVAPPPNLAESCLPLRLYTQVRNTQNPGSPSPSASDDVTIDSEVEVEMLVSNPYLARRVPQFTDPTPSDTVIDGGASDGDPAYTRAPQFYLELRAPEECSGLHTFAAGRNATTLPRALSLGSNFFASVLPFPSIPVPGPNTMTIAVTDEAGNVKNMDATLIYDDVAPVLSSSAPGSFTVTPGQNTTLIADLNFSTISVTDDRYNRDGRQFWGVWIANSRTPVSDPQNDPNLFWAPREAPGNATSFTISGWSLATGLRSDQVTPGTYYVYVRFLDGAGNPTVGHLTQSLTLEQATSVAVHLPLIRR